MKAFRRSVRGTLQTRILYNNSAEAAFPSKIPLRGSANKALRDDLVITAQWETEAALGT
jgi:hypothetical protein